MSRVVRSIADRRTRECLIELGRELGTAATEPKCSYETAAGDDTPTIHNMSLSEVDGHGGVVGQGKLT